ncbi:MAG: hypothetical protein BGO31_10365 [Bacteroidetes bacterium 43-16]|nr:MAG: hypothetical protein BGO31_10365 [Bacteroidetes bacterium 43-16]
MKINDNTGEFISQQEAVDFTHAYQTDNPTALKAFFAGKEKIAALLAQSDCMGVRIYMGYDQKNETQNLVLVGVDGSGEDLCSGLLLERLAPCPSSCSQNSILVVNN